MVEPELGARKVAVLRAIVEEDGALVPTERGMLLLNELVLALTS